MPFSLRFALLLASLAAAALLYAARSTPAASESLPHARWQRLATAAKPLAVRPPPEPPPDCAWMLWANVRSFHAPGHEDGRVPSSLPRASLPDPHASPPTAARAAACLQPPSATSPALFNPLLKAQSGGPHAAPARAASLVEASPPLRPPAAHAVARLQPPSATSPALFNPLLKAQSGGPHAAPARAASLVEESPPRRLHTTRPMWRTIAAITLGQRGLLIGACAG